MVTVVVAVVVAMNSDIPLSLSGYISHRPQQNSLSESQLVELVENSDLQRSDKRGKHSCAIKRYTVKRGDSLGKIWAKFGGSMEEAKKALSKLKGLGGSADILKIGETLSFFVSNRSGDIKGIRRTLDDGRVVLLKDTAAGELQPTVTSPIISEKERVASGSISSSLAHAAQQQDIPFEVVDELVDLFGNRIDFRKDLHLGDTFSIVFKESRNERGALVKTGEILAASIEIRGKMMAVVRHQNANQQPQYYNELGELLGESFLRFPVQFTRISSMFTKKRLHPILGKSRPHNGVDFSAPVGTPVRSIANGVISEVGYDSGRGNFIKISHGDRYATEYFHLSKITQGLRAGSRITRGMVIGGVGATGLATAPHLHFGFFDNKKYVDPLKADLPTQSDGHDTIPKDFLIAKLDVLKEQHEQSKLAQNLKSPSAG